MAEPETKEDGTRLIKVTIKSIPEPYFVQWSLKEKHTDVFKPIDVNAEKFKGTSIYLPHPVLMASHLDELEKYCFQIEVRNFIGSCKMTKMLGKNDSFFFNIIIVKENLSFYTHNNSILTKNITCYHNNKHMTCIVLLAC